MSKYTFKRDEADETAELTIKSSLCSDVTMCFYYFLMASGFHKTTVVDAFRTVAEEMDWEREQKKADDLE